MVWHRGLKTREEPGLQGCAQKCERLSGAHTPFNGCTVGLDLQLPTSGANPWSGCHSRDLVTHGTAPKRCCSENAIGKEPEHLLTCPPGHRRDLLGRRPFPSGAESGLCTGLWVLLSVALSHGVLALPLQDLLVLVFVCVQNNLIRELWDGPRQLYILQAPNDSCISVEWLALHCTYTSSGPRVRSVLTGRPLAGQSR